MKKKTVVIGSGISGLSISKMLQDKFDVTVLEKANETGGLIKCKRINGNLFHMVGGHVFNSQVPAVLDWFWKYFDRDTEFVKTARNAKILLFEKIIGYPIENFIYELPEEKIRLIIQDLLQIAARNSDRHGIDNFETFLKESFGKTLYDVYFGPYNAKIWNTDLSKVPLEWLDGKLPMPDLHEIIASNILKKPEEKMVHAGFYYPARDGSQFIINRLAEGLDINLSYTVSSIAYKDRMVIVNRGEQVADHLVYCGDVRKLHEIVAIEDVALSAALAAVKNLLSNGTSNVLCETDETDISWLYLPEKKFMAHRIIFTGNFSNTNNEGTKRKTCVVEFSGKHDRLQLVKELQHLPGNLTPLDFNYEPDSYIIHQAGTRGLISELKKQLAKYNIYLLGRFAEWEYYNMDKCIEAAMQLDRFLSPENN